jgi:anti-sigma factor ChrR (cupin superfamily)
MTTDARDHVLLNTNDMPWIPTGPGKSFRPIRFDPDGWTELMRVEPGAYVAPHRHTGEVHGLNISGRRELIEAGIVVGPGDYVYEPVGNIDSWRGVGDEPCVIHIRVEGLVEFFDEAGAVVGVASSQEQQAIYLEWCRANGIEPEPSLAVALT